MGLYFMLMAFFIADLCLVGLTMGRSPLDETWVQQETTHRFADATATSSALLEVSMLIICIRDLWYVPVS